MGRSRRAAIAGVLLAGMVAALGAQPAQPRLTFDAVSVKPDTAASPTFSMGFMPGGRFRALGVDARTLIAIAYQDGARLFPSQIVGGPAWLGSDVWDITAKVGDDLANTMSVSKRAALIQSLLETRFKLKVHRDTRDVQQYALVLARKDGTLGPQLRPTTVHCALDVTRCETRSLPGQFTSTSITAPGLAAYLANTVLRTAVTDRTGLAGTFAASLEWTPDSTSPTDTTSIFTALTNQLGLKLQPELAPAPVIVIDHVERPVEDR